MSYEIASTIMTVVMFVVFLGIVAWAWSGKQRDRFDAASQLPLEEELKLTDSRQFQERRK
jgi:cytochrome c oxidase cbb3-type subunit IV